jgi:hypothetical protein
MNTKSRVWIRKAGALTAVFLVILMGLSPAFAKEREHGKELTVQKKDGGIVKGELIAVRGHSLLLDSSNLSENSIDIGDVSAITIINKSQIWSGLGLGLLVGVGGGVVAGYASGDDRPGWFSLTAGEKAFLGGAVFGVIGIVVGGIAGALAGIDGTIDVNDANDPYQTSKVLEKLRSLSRFPDEK